MRLSIRRRARLLPLAFLATCAVTLAGQSPTPPVGFADAILGRWDLTVQGAEGPYPSWLEVHLRKESQLQARFVGRFGSVRYASQVSYENGDLTVVIPVQYEQNTTDLQFKGRLTGETLQGTTQEANGKTAQWTGKRAPALIRQAPPKWGSPVTLFNGKDLSGWKTRTAVPGACWKAEAGALTNVPPCADLLTERTFGDFKLHVEFKYPPKSNSGVYLRGRYEVQIEDNAGMALDPLRLGGVYGFLRPSVNAARPAGEWQAFDITLLGRRVTVVLNEKTIIENETIPGITGGAIDSDEGEPGPLMIQGDHGKIEFRNLTLTPAM